MRTISEPFRLQGGQGQYACSDKGLTLIEYNFAYTPLDPGRIIIPQWPDTPRTDLKSGATVLPYKGEPDKKK